MKKSATKVHSVEVLSQKLVVRKSSTKGAVSQAQGFYVA
jgi:hypothetical protein